MDIFSEIKLVEPEELERRGVIVPALNGGYICSCGSGQRENGTGLSVKRYDWGYLYHCWSCKENFTAVDLIGAYIGVDARMQIGRAQIASWYRENFSTMLREEIQTTPMKESAPKTELADLSKFYRFARNELEKYLRLNGGRIRGLSAKLLRQAGAGIATHTGSQNNWLVLPYDKCRCFKRELNGTRKYFTKGAKKSLYNPCNAFDGKTPVFIPEGEINCLSIVQAGFNAVAVGGVENYAKLPEWLSAENLPENLRLILLPDDDIFRNETMVENLLSVQVTLQELGYTVSLDFLNQNGMDANEILQREGEVELKNILTKIICYHEERQKENEEMRKKYGNEI